MTDETKATPYRVLARKYRPQDFGDLIGQQAMVTTLTNAFGTGRIAQAYMLTGVRGVGKTTTARILARALNYKSGEIDRPTVDLASEGEHCRAIMEGRHIDVIEMDAASHTGIDNMRDILESVHYAPALARYKVYIIDEVHQLSNHAFNALLKTLEEPPAHLKFIFATTEIRKVPVTVLSRCQRFDLRRIDASVLVAHLARIVAAEGIEAEEDALALIARAAEGSVRDALSILDQAIAHCAGRIAATELRAMLGLSDRARVIYLFEQVMAGDIAAALAEMKEQYELGADPAVVMTDLADFVHYVTRLKYMPQAADDAALSQAERQRGAGFARDLSVKALGRAWQILVKGIAEISQSERPLAAADMVLVRLTHAASLPTPDELLRGLDGAGVATAATKSPSAPVRQPQAAEPSGVAQLASPSRLRPAPQPRAEPSADAAAQKLTLGRFEELVLLAEDRRDIMMRTCLRRHVRLVSFADGRMEFNLAGNPPPNFVQELSSRLQAWTGKRWIIAASSAGGAPTMEEAEQAEQADRNAAASSDPAVEAILARFPGARIVDVRMRAPEQAETDIAPGEPGAGLDDFYD